MTLFKVVRDIKYIGPVLAVLLILLVAPFVVLWECVLKPLPAGTRDFFDELWRFFIEGYNARDDITRRPLRDLCNLIGKGWDWLTAPHRLCFMFALLLPVSLIQEWYMAYIGKQPTELGALHILIVQGMAFVGWVGYKCLAKRGARWS